MKLKKKQLSLIITAAIIIFAYFLDGNKVENKVIISPETASIVTSSTPSNITSTSTVAGEKIADLDKIEPVIKTTPVNNTSDNDLFTVVKVIDGDTFDVSIDGKTERLRLIGINTPETVDPRRKVECFGKEASAYAKKLLTGKKVKLASDTSQDIRDKYGRLLVYAWLEDGTFFNETMISQGFAYEYTYKTPYLYQSDFKQAQKNAQDKKLGLWSETSCNGKK